MALNQTNKLAWIVETIYKAKKISFEDLNRKWMDNTDLSGGEELLKRTFHKWRWSIFDTFGLNIECEKGGQYRYYIENCEDINNGSIESWLFNTYSVSNSLIESKSIKERILLEDVPSGRKYLEPIICAMKENRFIHITHYNYWRGDTRNYYVMPLCVKLFKQRWYLVGRMWPSNNDIIFSLDRLCDFRLSSHTFEYPNDFNPKEFFEGCIGVIVGVKETLVSKIISLIFNYKYNNQYILCQSFVKEFLCGCGFDVEWIQNPKIRAENARIDICDDFYRVAVERGFLKKIEYN